MKIVIYTPTFLPKRSGAEIFHHNLAVRLAARGHGVAVVMPRKMARALADCGWALPYDLIGIPGNIWSYYKRWPALAHAWSGIFLDSIQRRHGFSVWHGVMSFPTGVSLIRWARKRHLPHLIRTAGDDVISSKDGSIGLLGTPFIARLVQKELPRADAVVALSATIAENLRGMGVASDAIHEIPNAVDLEKFGRSLSDERRCRLRISLGLHPERFLFLCVGRNHPQKNYPVLLDAAQKLRLAGLDFQILILGRDTDALENCVTGTPLEGRIFGREIRPGEQRGACPEFPPPVLVETMQSADAFVMPSVLEGFSTALLEAMAARLPVITTDAPGCRDFVRGGLDAIMVPTNDVSALAAAMRQLLQHPALRNEWAEKARRRASEFGWERVVGCYEELYYRLAARR